LKAVNTVLRFFRIFFNVPIITFIAGGLLATAIQIFFEKSILGNFLLLLIFISIYIFYTIVTIERMNKATIKDVSNNHKETIGVLEYLQNNVFAYVQSLGVTVRWIPNPTVEKDEGYELSLRIVQNAQDSIYIISDYSPHDRPISYTDERNEYLSVIARVVNEHISHNDHFEYKRILQSDKADQVRRILERRHLEGDEQTFMHCGDVIKSLQTNKTRVIVQFFVSKPIPSSPSVLIVDQKHILFTIPGKKSVIGSINSDYADLTTIGVLHIEDFTGKVAADFKRMFDSFANDSVIIANVER
jgi:hypothetical protein